MGLISRVSSRTYRLKNQNILRMPGRLSRAEMEKRRCRNRAVSDESTPPTSPERETESQVAQRGPINSRSSRDYPASNRADTRTIPHDLSSDGPSITPIPHYPSSAQGIIIAEDIRTKKKKDKGKKLKLGTIFQVFSG